jgi:amidophosphoribosyltransferase
MCAIAGAIGVKNASYVVSMMLKALQHRGQEGAGIVSTDGTDFHEKRGLGLVDEVFRDTDFASALPGAAAIGHLRYTTSGDARSERAIQPLAVMQGKDPIAIAHNGNLTNYVKMREDYQEQGAIFHSKSDTELFLHLFTRAKGDRIARLKSAFSLAEGAYSLLILAKDALYAVVDPHGFRPLSFAHLNGGIVFASETCAFDLKRATGAEAIAPGEMVTATDAGVSRVRFAPDGESRWCSFEQVYFARPDSVVFGTTAGVVRTRLGAALAACAPAKVDLVTAVPDSSNAIALAYANALGVPFEFALIRNHYMGRTFITPTKAARELGVRVKLNPVAELVRGKSVGVVDDSIVRGTTARKVVALIREAGAREVHLRIGSPPVIHTCHWGINTPRREDLVAAVTPLESLPDVLGADSVGYLTDAAFRGALRDTAGTRFCTTCFTGVWPIRR